MGQSAQTLRSSFAVPQGRLVRGVSAVEEMAPLPQDNPFHLVATPVHAPPVVVDIPERGVNFRRTLINPAVAAPLVALSIALAVGFMRTPQPSSISPKQEGRVTGASKSADFIQELTQQYSLPQFSGRAASIVAVSLDLPIEPVVEVHAVEPYDPPETHVVAPVVHRAPSPQVMVSKVLSIIRTHAPKRTDANQLAQAIVREAANEAFDPLFVAAVIKSESTFNALARSHKGAQGLMQLMPRTGAWLADKEEIPRGRLTDPGYNLKLGIKYLKHLDELYKGDKVFMLIAYNWGPGRVESATEGHRRVPPEVMTYAIKIMNDYRAWRTGVS